MIDEHFKYSEETSEIIGLALLVHTELGNGFPESIYQRALEIELGNHELIFKREFEMPVIYKGLEIGKRRVDFLINDKISVELKAVTSLEPAHINQALNYLEALQLEIGLLLNFGSNSLQIKRILNKKLSDKNFK